MVLTGHHSSDDDDTSYSSSILFSGGGNSSPAPAAVIPSPANNNDQDEASPTNVAQDLFTYTTAKDGMSSSCRKYTASNGDKAHLYAMCFGLSAEPDGKDNERAGANEAGNRILGDFTVEPFLSSKNKKSYKPLIHHGPC